MIPGTIRSWAMFDWANSSLCSGDILAHLSAAYFLSVTQ